MQNPTHFSFRARLARLTFLLCLLIGLILGCSESSSPPEASPAPPANESIDAAPAQASPSVPVSREVVVVADPWCPHNCEAGADQEGYMVDIAREAFALAGYTLKYRNFSWARALKMTREGDFNAVVGAFKTDAPDFIFPETPQGRASISLFTHPDKDWSYTGITSLKNQTLLAINGYSYTAELDEYIARHRENPERILILSGPDPLKRALLLLDRRRTDVVAAEDSVMAWATFSTPGSTRPRKAGEVKETLSYLAFSPVREDSAELARILSEGTRKLVESGRVNAILESYGVTPFPLWPSVSNHGQS